MSQPYLSEITLMGVTIHFTIQEKYYGYAFTAEHTLGKFQHDGFLTYEDAAQSAGDWLVRFLKNEKDR